MPITPEFALKLGFAAGKVLKEIVLKTNQLWLWVKIRVYRVIF